MGPNVVLDHVSVITASGAAKTPQSLHADVGFVGEHVEVHLPLVDMTADMGPTLFCPASHGLAQRGKAGMTSGVERALDMWYLTQGARCGTTSETSYAPALKMGQATIYDANVFHGGTANHAGKDRPVLQLSFSRSPQSRDERNYTRNTFNDNKEAREAVLKEIQAFRHSPYL
jgi:ectoine hydroxylase-related dioxygenase (phytanoyl-CoA dioxygenase family)